MTEAALREAARVLEKGGRIVIEDYYNASGAAGKVQRFFFLFTEGNEARDWLRTDIQGLLRRTGFKNFRRKFTLKKTLQIITAEKA
jgi:ubiquinone/menaquinone biosynthesis C-methylase UbiE